MRSLLLALACAFLSASSVAQEATPAETSTTATAARKPSRGNAFNPEIGINALMLYQNSNRGNESNVANRNGFGIQEAELQFSADVDPYWRLNSIFSVHQEVEVDTTVTPQTRTAEFVFEPEELYAESMALPVVTLKFGKFKAAMGRHNLLHTHAFPFIDAPLANQALLGDEGLNDVGASVSSLLPVGWFSELTLQALSGQGEGLDYFQGPSANSSVAVGHFKNLWDLTDDLTFEVGLSAATGKNKTDQNTDLQGADLTFKWRGSRERALIWSTEYLTRSRNEVTNERAKGVASWLQYQFAQRWWAQIRSESLEFKDQDPAGTLHPDFQRRQSLAFGFVPSEFSAVRLHYDRLDDGAAKPEDRVMVQLNYSIGAHPAHTY